MPAKGGELKCSVGDPKENRLAQRRRGAEDIMEMRNVDLGTKLPCVAEMMNGELGYTLDSQAALFKEARSLASRVSQNNNSAPQPLCGIIIR